KNFEDHLVERKTIKDEKDWKKTAVAFANSAPVGLPAVLFIGVRDNGEIETPQKDLDEAQKKFNVQMERVYPRIAYVPKIINDNGQQALAVVIPNSSSMNSCRSEIARRLAGIHPSLSAMTAKENQPCVSPSGAVTTWDGRLDNRSDLIYELSALLRVVTVSHEADTIGIRDSH